MSIVSAATVSHVQSACEDGDDRASYIADRRWRTARNDTAGAATFQFPRSNRIVACAILTSQFDFQTNAAKAVWE